MNRSALAHSALNRSSGSTTHTSKARRAPLTAELNDLALRAGPPLTTAELAHIIGMSATFIRKEIESGYLRAIRMGRGRKPVFRIDVREARRYLRALGLI